MVTASIILTNEVGLHARPAALLLQEVTRFKSDVKLIRNNKSYNARSILGILSMGACKGDEITITASGEDEHDAVDAIKNLIGSFKE